MTEATPDAARIDLYRSAGRTDPAADGARAAQTLSPADIRGRKGNGAPLVMVTAYDAPGAATASEAGVDMILVGDSLAMVVLGYPDTLSIGVDEMAHHVAAVARARPVPLVVADLPWMSYHLGRADTVTNAARLVRAGAQAVKLEGGRKRMRMIDALVDAEIPVMGHLGLTPQSVKAIGGFKVQARTDEAAEQLLLEAKALVEAGVFALVLEAIPAPVAAAVTAAVDVPTIGIGAGADCDGQVLVYHDVLGLGAGHQPRFVRRYADLRAAGVEAIERYAADVRDGAFPGPAESYGLRRSPEA